MQATIKILDSKKLIGKKMNMSLADNKTPLLWKSFMMERGKVNNPLSENFFSLQVYDQDYFKNFNPHQSFEKWACVEVADHIHLPEGMEAFTLNGGLYAVFHYKGSSAEGAKVFSDIFETWLPKSEYTLDNRPHFEVLGEKYKNNDPNSEEEIWIPVRLKN